MVSPAKWAEHFIFLMMLTNIPDKQTMKANLLLYFSFEGVLYSHLEQIFKLEQKKMIL